MKSRKTIKEKMCVLVMLSFLACTLFPLNIFNIPKVNADAQEDLNDALTWAKAYLDRSYTEFNSSYAAMRDLPGLPFVMEDVTDDKWICPAKATQAVQDGNDGPDWGYYGGCGIDPLDYGYDSDRLKLRYRWDTECDNTFDGVVMYVELITLDNVNMKCYANITSKADSDHCALWLDNETVIDPVTVGAYFNRTNAYGWFTTRFVVRHGTKIAANMYNVLGETDKATKLLNLWYGSGYTKDTYDGVWGASNSYDDYIMLFPWAAHALTVMPDCEVWGNIPWFQMGQEGTEHSGVPYRSQLHNDVVRTLGFTPGTGLFGKSWWEIGFTFKMAWACHLLNKYNVSDASKLAEAKQLIDDVSWNGLGVNCETLRVGPTLISLYQYACYVPYANAEYLAALTKYWQLTGDEFYGERADEVAGILLKVQVKPGDKIRVTDSNGDIRLIWRPDNIGGFMCGYKYGGGFDFGNSPFWLADKYFWCTMASGLYNRDYAELSSCGWTNHETTLMSYAALYQYNQTGRTPLTSSVDFTMPFFDAQATTSHSDHGCDSIQADNSGNIRTFLSESAYGESWSTVTYSWTVELPALTNFRTKLTAYIPYYGQDGNAVERWVRIYYHNGTLLVSDYDKPINGVGGYGERYIIYTNMTPIDSLIAGIYTIKLTFRFSCGWAGEFAVGYRYDYLMRPTEPMHIETFGCDGDRVIPSQTPPTIITPTPNYNLNIEAVGPGSISPSPGFMPADFETPIIPINSSDFTQIEVYPNQFLWLKSPHHSDAAIIYLGGGSCFNVPHNPQAGPGDYDCREYVSDPDPFSDAITLYNAGYDVFIPHFPVIQQFDPVTLDVYIDYFEVAGIQLRTYIALNYNYTNVYLGGTSAGGCIISLGFYADTNQNNLYDKVFMVDGWMPNIYDWDGPYCAPFISIPTCIFVDTKGLAFSLYFRDFYNLLGSTQKEYHLFDGEHGEAWTLQERGTGRTLVSILNSIPTTYMEGTTATITAIPNTGKYFWYWKVNNTALGIYQNFTANPLYLYVDHDYNVTAYFGDTYEPPSPNCTLIIVNPHPTLGNTSPPPGTYSYVRDSIVSVNATANTGYIFREWCTENNSYPTNESITLTMDRDRALSATFSGSIIYFRVLDSSTHSQMLDVNISIHMNDSWIRLYPLITYVEGVPYLVIDNFTIGTYSFFFSKSGYYSYSVTKTMPTAVSYYFPTVYLNPIVYGGGGGGTYLRLKSSLITFYATMPYSNETQYADFDHYIKVQVLPGTTGTLKFVIHYDTDYPVVEMDAENLTLTEFDLEALYQHYCLSSYEDMQQASHFTGLKISSNTLLQINLEMPQALDFWHRPSELLKIGEDGGISSFSSWQYADRTLTLNFEPGDPTVSMIFHAIPDAMTLTFWNLIPFIFIVGSVAMLIPTILAAKRRNFKEFAVLLIGFIIVTALIPIIPQLMA